MARLPVALQMYTVRDDLAADFVGTLRKVAEIGYTAVEIDPPAGMTAAEARTVLADLGLTAVAAHIGFDDLASDPSAALAAAKELGCSYAVCPSIPEERRGDAAAYRAAGQILSSVGAKAKEYGLQLAYHNHNFEFEHFDGRLAYEILIEAADPEMLVSEFDVYWAQYGGVDPVAYIRKLGSRCRILHMKDMAADADRSFAEVGEGILDMEAIVAAGQDAGVEWYIVEQDRSTKRPPIEAARLSLSNMRARGWA
jgi:sugar phosphate isomerase/epimerase